MKVSSDSVTSATLLSRLHESPSDQAAWAEFDARYGSRIKRWCREWGLQEADCQDVAQTVLMKLLNAMQTFHYDPSQRFRGWLKTIAHHAWQDLVRSRRKLVEAGNVQSEEPLQSLAARDDLEQQLQAAYEQELVQCALARVRLRVQPMTWEAFRVTALDGMSGVEASAQLRMAVTSFYKAKSNVLRLLETEVRHLEQR